MLELFNCNFLTPKTIICASSYCIILFCYCIKFLIVFEPQDGQIVGNLNFLELFDLFVLSTSMTCGITSPALSILIRSPILMSSIYFILIVKCCIRNNNSTNIYWFNFSNRSSAPVLPTISILITLVLHYQQKIYVRLPILVNST